jgi:hypothetical protein
MWAIVAPSEIGANDWPFFFTLHMKSPPVMNLGRVSQSKTKIASQVCFLMRSPVAQPSRPAQSPHRGAPSRSSGFRPPD